MEGNPGIVDESTWRAGDGCGVDTMMSLFGAWVEEEDIYIGQGYRYTLRDQDTFCLVIQDSLQGKSELLG